MFSISAKTVIFYAFIFSIINQPPTTKLPACAIIAINMKNIRLTVSTHDIIRIIELPADSKDFVILESLTGSTSAAHIL